MMFIGGPLDGVEVTVAHKVGGQTYAYKRTVGRGDIHRVGVHLEPGQPTQYDATVTDYYRLAHLYQGNFPPTTHYVHASLTDEQARKDLK